MAYRLIIAEAFLVAASACIGCGACVAACPNSSAMLFTAAKIAHLGELPQGEPERLERTKNMIEAMDAAGFGNWVHRRNSNVKASRYAIRIRTDDGLTGEYVTHWVGTPAAMAQSLMLAPHLLGRDPEAREQIYDDLKRELRAYDHMGHGPLDIALWDLAGKKYGTPVSKLLGGFRTRLPTYASTYHGQDEPGGLDGPEAFADFAEHCKSLGYRGFKIHGWHDGDRRREARNVLGVRARVGADMALMIDPACELHRVAVRAAGRMDRAADKGIPCVLGPLDARCCHASVSTHRWDRAYGHRVTGTPAGPRPNLGT